MRFYIFVWSQRFSNGFCAGKWKTRENVDKIQTLHLSDRKVTRLSVERAKIKMFMCSVYVCNRQLNIVFRTRLQLHKNMRLLWRLFFFSYPFYCNLFKRTKNINNKIAYRKQGGNIEII